MTWHAKPSGPYGFSTNENYDNSMEIYSIFSAQGFTVEAISGICANIMSEGGMNPWRWQGDVYRPALGYGLFQFTPSTDYTSLPGATPNFSVTEITQGATPEDGARQCQAVYENNPAKWMSLCWRVYWDANVHSNLYNRTRYILNTWGNGTRITLDQFKLINDYAYACDCFLACFEGEGDPSDYADRERVARDFYERFTGVVPPDPPTPPDPPEPPDPPPTPPTPGSFNIYWFLKRQADKQNINLILK